MKLIKAPCWFVGVPLIHLRTSLQAGEYKNYLTHPMVRFHIHSFFTTFMLMRQTQETLRQGVRRLIAANPEPTLVERCSPQVPLFTNPNIPAGWGWVTGTFLTRHSQRVIHQKRNDRRRLDLSNAHRANKWPAGERAKNWREYSCSTAKINAQLVRAVVY